MTDNPNFPISTAVVSWFDKSGLHIRVYSTDGYNVMERCLDQGSTVWVTGQFKAPGGAVSATCWVDSAGNNHIRVYCTWQNVTTEWANDTPTGWGKGTYTTI